MDSFESQLRFGMNLSNLSHNENDTTFHGNRFLKNLIDRAQIETKKKSSSTTTALNRSTHQSVNGKKSTRLGHRTHLMPRAFREACQSSS